LGTQARIMPTESSATAATKTKAARQPSHWPRAEATGTPSSVPLVSPSITRPTARARWWGSLSAAATSAAMPK
jgi:hypothetical protein